MRVCHTLTKKTLSSIGRKFGILTVLSFSYVSNHGDVYWNCLCDCGKTKVAMNGSLKSGDTKSCGCLYRKRKNNLKHGMVYTATYESWSGMLKRCTNSNSDVYRHYGGRGIKVCVRWKKFENFYGDMGDKPKNKSLDRINNNENYTPKNCKWSTQKEQTNNKRNNHRITIKGKTRTVTEWSDFVGIKKDTIFMRIHRGWSPEKAVLTPLC